MAANAYKRAVDELDSKTARDLDAPYRATVLEPIGKLCSYFPEINKTIDKRNKKLIDYDAARSRHRKLIDKPSDDATKLPRAEKEYEDAKVIFEAMNQQLLEELPQLVDLRIPYLDPSFEAMVRMQARFAEEGYEKMGGVQRYFAEGIREEYADGQLDTQVSIVLFSPTFLQCAGPLTACRLCASGRGRLAGDEGAIHLRSGPVDMSLHAMSSWLSQGTWSRS